MKAFLLVFLGAGAGGALRHAVGLAATRWLGTGFPYGTLAVNVIGGLVVGALVEWFALRFDPGQSWRIFLVTGLLGGFTTFSAFSLDFATLWEDGRLGIALGYAVASVVLSLAAIFAGLWLARAALA